MFIVLSPLCALCPCDALDCVTPFSVSRKQLRLHGSGAFVTFLQTITVSLEQMQQLLHQSATFLKGLQNQQGVVEKAPGYSILD